MEQDAFSRPTNADAQYQESKPSHWWSRPRFLFAIIFGWYSITGGRFLAPYLEQQQERAPDVGLLLASQQAVALLAGPWAGRLADHLESRCASSGGRVYAVLLGVVLGTLCTLAQDVVNDNSSFMTLLVLRALYALASSFTIPIVDAICVDVSGGDDYGRERLWGAVSWAIIHLMLGPSLDRFGFGIFFPLSAFAGTLSVGALILYHKSNNQRYASVVEDTESALDGEPMHHLGEQVNEEQVEPEKSEDNTRLAVSTWSLLKSLVVGNKVGSRASVLLGITFLGAVAAMGAGQAVVDNLIFLYFEFLGSSYSIMGLTVVLTVLFEIPIFHVSDQLLGRFGGGLLLQAAMICYVIRVIGYSLLPSGHAVFTLFLEPLHGVTYACSQTSVVDICAQRAPAGYAATFQGFVFSIRGIGAILGLLVGGRAEENWSNPRLLYVLAAAVVGSVSLLFGIASACCATPTPTAERNGRSCVQLTERRLDETDHIDDGDESMTVFSIHETASSTIASGMRLAVVPIS